MLAQRSCDQDVDRCWGVSGPFTGPDGVACHLLGSQPLPFLWPLPWVLPLNPRTQLFKLFLPLVGILSILSSKKIILCVNCFSKAFSRNGPSSDYQRPSNADHLIFRCRSGDQHHVWRERRPSNLFFVALEILLLIWDLTFYSCQNPRYCHTPTAPSFQKKALHFSNLYLPGLKPHLAPFVSLFGLFS